VPGFTVARARPLIGDLPRCGGSWPSAPRRRPTTPGELRQRLAGSPSRTGPCGAGPGRTHTAAVLGYEGPEQVEAGRAFRELGFDSLTAVEVRNRLKRRHWAEAAADPGVRLPDPGRAGAASARGDPAGRRGGDRFRVQRAGTDWSPRWRVIAPDDSSPDAHRHPTAGAAAKWAARRSPWARRQ